MDAGFRSAGQDYHMAPDIASELDEWFSVAGDVDDFIYFWDTYGESER